MPTETGIAPDILRNAIRTRRKIHKASGGTTTVEATIPKIVVEREMFKLGLSLREFITHYEVEWIILTSKELCVALRFVKKKNVNKANHQAKQRKAPPGLNRAK